MCYFHNVVRFVFVCNVFWVEFQRYCCCWLAGVVFAAAAGGGGREEEVSLGVIITNTEIKFHILLLTLH